jgi:outer membrane biosynthesis protein TonB
VQNPGVRTTLRVEFVVRRNGTVDNVQVERAPTDEIESGLADYIGNWLFDLREKAARQRRRVTSSS